MTRLQLTLRLLKPLLFLAATGPLIWMIAGAAGALYLGADPVHSLQLVTGLSCLVLLLCTLGVTPLRRLLRYNELIRVRRMLGLWAFAYAVMHALIYFILDQSLDPGLILADTIEHPRIAVGFTAFLLLIPLAITSTDRMVRRLGRRWGRLHRLVYLATGLGVLHYLMVQKLDLREGLIFASVFVALMLARVFFVWPGRGKRVSSSQFPVPSSPGDESV